MKPKLRKRNVILASVLAVSVLAVSTSALADHQDDFRENARRNDANAVVVDRNEMLALLQNMEQQVQQMKKGNPHNRGKHNGSDARQLNALQKQIDLMQWKIRQAPSVGRARTGSARPMSPQAHAQLLVTLRRSPYSSSRIAILQDVARFNAFTTAQVTDIIRLFPYSSDKVKVATMLYPSVVDPQNFYQVVAQLPYESDRRRLRTQIARL